MKTLIKNSLILMVVFAIATVPGCKKDAAPAPLPAPPPEIPVIPPSPNPPTGGLTSAIYMMESYLGEQRYTSMVT